MIIRAQEAAIASRLEDFPVVTILGARQVGKTTLAKTIAAKKKGSLYLDLERPSDLNKLSDPESYLVEHRDKLLVLDEIQRVPELFPVLRSLVDDNRKPGRFLILGPASPELLRQSSESLAGRIAFLELSPLQLSETGGKWQKLWLRGGFPGSVLAASDIKAFDWREAFIQTHLERDIPGFGIRVPAPTLGKFWRMLAHLQGQLLNASRIAASMQVSTTAIMHYLDILQHTFMLRRLQPFHQNSGKRLIKSPKTYLRDSGLLHALLGIQTMDELLSHPIAGPSFEGWALEQVLAVVPPSWKPTFYRTAAGAEIDLVLERPGNIKPVVVEFKLSSTPVPARGFWEALEDLRPEKAFVVAPVKEPYPLKKNVRVIPLADLKKIGLEE